ncbi:MAG: 2-amino-4-hydroxy-6-hydroxymethyldihydropteridine diphosphokinase [Wenzhouxiangella sp.]
MNPAWIGMGSNVGSAGPVLSHAAKLLSGLDQTWVRALSPVYRTRPWGGVEQPDFLNAAAELTTDLSPSSLLVGLLEIERQLGRNRNGPRWGPREIDLDLLVYAGQVIDQPDLVVPHPHLHERAFVLVPLNDISPSLVVPGHGRVDDLLAALDPAERDGVRMATTSPVDWPASRRESRREPT